jgi:hypothetical protein
MRLEMPKQEKEASETFRTDVSIVVVMKINEHNGNLYRRRNFLKVQSLEGRGAREGTPYRAEELYTGDAIARRAMVGRHLSTQEILWLAMLVYPHGPRRETVTRHHWLILPSDSQPTVYSQRNKMVDGTVNLMDLRNAQMRTFKVQRTLKEEGCQIFPRLMGLSVSEDACKTIGRAPSLI